MTELEPTLDYFEQYREKKRQLSAIIEEHRALKETIERKKSEARELEKEIFSMKRIITTMIDHGLDPVEAKLKNDLPNLNDSIWEDDYIYTNSSDEMTITLSGSSISDMIDLANINQDSSYPLMATPIKKSRTITGID